MAKGPTQKKKVITIKKRNAPKKEITVRKPITVKTVDKQSKADIEVAEVEHLRRLELSEKIEEKKPLPHLFKPGQSGNPNGRPAGTKNLTTLVRNALQEIDDDGMKLEDKLVQNIVKLAVRKGNLKIIELMWAYFDGRPNQPMDVNVIPGELDPQERAQLDQLMRNNQ